MSFEENNCRIQSSVLSVDVMSRVVSSVNLAWEVLVAVSGYSWQCPMEDSPSVPVQEPPSANRDANPEHNGRSECIRVRPCLRVHVCEWKTWRCCSSSQLWALLHFIMPTLFDSHEEFNEWFSKDIESHAENKSAIDESQSNLEFIFFTLLFTANLISK